MAEIRVLTPDDWKAWREVRLGALAEAPYAFGARLSDWQGNGDREERWRNRLAIPGSHNLIAEFDGRPAGMVSGVPTPTAGTLELISMWVHPAARGRGVGDTLVSSVVRWAQKSGGDQLRLAVTHGNEAAVGLYRRHGFVTTGELGDLMPDGVHREQVMVRNLDRS
ncbi:GNAT family N-acetyltransferase [Micromonospora sp. NPDC048909]|uniref:GNAT family N-acetyltransferase n=1 Tax=Micromonospora sp. NPDC048909 TaxID=3155643 RepID=UPI0033E210CB